MAIDEDDDDHSGDNEDDDDSDNDSDDGDYNNPDYVQYLSGVVFAPVISLSSMTLPPPLIFFLSS